MPNEQAYMSMEIVQKFVHDIMEQTPKGSQNYPDKLMELGLHRNEARS